MIDILELVLKLTGPIDPVGETHVDDKRFENLKALTELTDKLLTEIDRIAYEYQNNHEFSIKRASEHCSKFYDKIGIKN